MDLLLEEWNALLEALELAILIEVDRGSSRIEMPDDARQRHYDRARAYQELVRTIRRARVG